MATLRAHQAFDIREVIRAGGRLTEAEDRIVIRHGDWRTSVTGDFHAVPTGTVGELLGIAVTFGTRLVFEAAVDRSGYTAFDILALRDNHRFFAYVLSGADRVDGSAGADYLIGFGGNDTILGGGGRDRLFGGSDDDRVSGRAGGDFLSGGLGIDRLAGDILL
jgi:Ca2+-binding RTX toxin-like protein